jgi:hypothetical protein
MTLTGKPNWKAAIGLPGCIFLCCYLITLSSKFTANQLLLSSAILVDLLVVAPIVYFLVIRKSEVPALTVTRVFIVGVLFAGLILNVRNSSALFFIKTFISPLIEVFVVFVISRKFYVANKKARQAGEGKIDFLLHSRMVMQQVTGSEKIGNIIASEISVFYYGFIAGRSKTTNYTTTFTIYKQNGLLLILGTFLSLFVVETTAVHFLISIWSKLAAWIFTTIGLYSCLQLYAHIRAVKARPVVLGDNAVEIHNGLAGDAFIHYCNIEKFEMSNKLPAGNNVMKIALIKGLENHNCVIFLKQQVNATKIFGIKRKAGTILFFVDEPKAFAEALSIKMAAAESCNAQQIN